MSSLSTKVAIIGAAAAIGAQSDSTDFVDNIIKKRDEDLDTALSATESMPRMKDRGTGTTRKFASEKLRPRNKQARKQRRVNRKKRKK